MGNSRDWRVPGTLLFLSLVPSGAGIARLAGLVAGGPVTAGNVRFFASAMPVVVHIMTALPFCALGAFQFSTGLRQRYPAWHRLAGRLVAGCGLLAGLSGLWMTTRYPIAPQLQGMLLYCFRLLSGGGMLLCIAFALAAVRRRDFVKHGAWMIRGYALGQGAGTQVLLALPCIVLSGEPTGLPRDILMSGAWVINCVVAEWIIRRSAR